MLSFEEFSERDENNVPRHRNFFGYFLTDSYLGLAHQARNHYVRFATEHPELASSLCEKVKNETSSDHNIPASLDEDLYEAYKIMSGYGVSDKDLFS